MSAQKANKKKENKTDPASFEGDGIYFTAKFIGVSDVADFRGNEMCQETMQKLKAAVKSSGKHKLRILVNISLEGIKLIEEKTMAVNYEHTVSRISFISIDTTDSRAFGYVFEPGDGTHKFFAIKTEKSAGQVIIAIRDLFETVFEMKKKERDEAAEKERKKKEAIANGENAPIANTISDSTTNSVVLASIAATKPTKPEDPDHVYSGMDSMGTALANFDDSPFVPMAVQDTPDPWNVNNSYKPRMAGHFSPGVVLLPPPPASPRVVVGGSPMFPTMRSQSQHSTVQGFHPLATSSAFPSAVSSNVSLPTGTGSEVSPVSPAITLGGGGGTPPAVFTAVAAAPAAVSTASSVTSVAEATPPAGTVVIQTPPKVPISPVCALPIVLDPFNDKLFCSPAPTQVSHHPTTAPTMPSTTGVAAAPFTAVFLPGAQPTPFAVAFPERPQTKPFAAAFPDGPQSTPFAAFPEVTQPTSFAAAFPEEPQQPTFAAFPKDPQQPTFAAFPKDPQDPFGAFPDELQQPVLVDVSSTESSQRSTPSKFDIFSMDTSFTSVFSQQTNETGENSPKMTATASSSSKAKSPDLVGDQFSVKTNLFQDLCSFGSNQHHKKPAELFPRIDPPPSKKLNQLMEESVKSKDPDPNQVFDAFNQPQASDSSLPFAIPLDYSLTTNPEFFPDPAGFGQSPTVSDSGFEPPNSHHSQQSADSSGIFSLSGNHSTDVTYAMTKLDLSETEFSHPAPSHPPPPLPPSVIAAAILYGSGSGPGSISSISPFPDERLGISDDEFNLPSPAEPPPPLPSESTFTFEPSPVPTPAPPPPPRPRPSDITKLPKPPPPRPRRNLSSSSSLQSVGKSNSPVPSVVSLEGAVPAYSILSSCFSPSPQASDLSATSLPSTKADDTKFDSIFRASSVTSHHSLDNSNIHTANNSSPQPWSAFAENAENSCSPISNQSFSSGRDFFPSNMSHPRTGSVSSRDSNWPDNNPFVTKTNASPSLASTASPDPFLHSPYAKAGLQQPKTSQTDPFIETGRISQQSDKSQTDPFVIPSLTRLKSVSDSTDPFRVPHHTKIQLNNTQKNPGSSSGFPDIDPKNDPTDPFIIPTHVKLQADSSSFDPFVIPSNINLSLDNTRTNVFVSSSHDTIQSDISRTSPFITSIHNTLQSDNTRTDAFVSSSLSTVQLDNTRTDTLVSSSQNPVQSNTTHTDPFVSPSHNTVESANTWSDPFEGFSQWSTSSKFQVDVDTTNGR